MAAFPRPGPGKPKWCTLFPNVSPLPPFPPPSPSRFASDGAVICFGVFMRTQEGGVHQKVGDMLQVLPSERYNAHMVPEDRSLTCPEPGTYMLHFDNTYSLLQFKNISYTVDVVLPDGHVQSPRSNRGDERLE
ncbi:SEC14-like protein 3 isoform X2 [Salvelinus fontinalis]|uniref:SEC14-like protein 3 isoform X2 n=1 Tax=Salvelinus fontinalis TaxID=8038 RepID=UPI0024861B3E|nr:SEC14-like protein 3 isoform X2 [Salvelinus fontinalis]